MRPLIPIAAVVLAAAIAQNSSASLAASPAAAPIVLHEAGHAAGHGPDHASVVAARQAGFKLSLASFLGIKAAIARGDDVTSLALPASAIAGWGRAIPAMFPEGSQTATSKALPTVWSDRAGFEAAAVTMTEAATKLAMLAKAGDTAGVATQYGELGKACGGCHTKYRMDDAK